MRILTIRQPWAWALAAGIKTVENRTRNLAGTYRGPVALHAAKTPDDPIGLATILDLTPVRSFSIVHGAIIATATLTDVHHADTCEHGTGWCTSWSDPESWHLVFHDARQLAAPIPFTGALGLRHLDPDTAAAVTRAAGGAA